MMSLLATTAHRLASRFLYVTPIIRHNHECRKNLLLPLYAKLEAGRQHDGVQTARTEKTVVLMSLNETTFTGGLSDRLRGIVSVYDECRRQGLPFRIYFSTPRLTDYLQPNTYDWRIAADEISYDGKEAYPCTLLTYHKNINDPIQAFVQRHVLRHYLKRKYTQIHVYTNMAGAESHFAERYHELFRPTPALQEQIDRHLAALGGKGNYVAMVYRFRQLLGDFKEGGETLPATERGAYIDKCTRAVEQMHAAHPKERILVTSDSGTFLRHVALLPYVYVIPGEVVHMGFTFDAEKSTYMKSFVDYFVLANAKSITLARDKKMYHSGFAARAAMLHGAGYDESWLE